MKPIDLKKYMAFFQDHDTGLYTQTHPEGRQERKFTSDQIDLMQKHMPSFQFFICSWAMPDEYKAMLAQKSNKQISE